VQRYHVVASPSTNEVIGTVIDQPLNPVAGAANVLGVNFVKRYIALAKVDYTNTSPFNVSATAVIRGAGLKTSGVGTARMYFGAYKVPIIGGLVDPPGGLGPSRYLFMSDVTTTSAQVSGEETLILAPGEEIHAALYIAVEPAIGSTVLVTGNDCKVEVRISQA
jgi:hypothetical protein